MFENRNEILEVLRMPEEDYRREHNGNRLVPAGMVGYSNICRSRCLG